MVTTKHKSRAERGNIKKMMKLRKKKSQKTTKPKWQTETQGKRNNEDIEQPENKRLNGSTKSSSINNHPKFKLIDFTNQKTQRGQMD